MATSREFITDRGATTIDVNAEAMLKAYGENGTGQSIVLADTAADQLRVGGDATLQSVADEMGAGGGADILVGIDPTTPDRMTDSGAAVNLGGTNFDSRSMGDTTRGDVSLLQENRIEFFGENYAESLVATSREFITDRGATTIDVNAEAMLKAYGENGTGQSIVLADTAADQLRVGGDATLQSVADEMGAGGGADILVGIDPTTPDRMTDSGAAVNLGGTNFDSRSMGDTTRGDVSLLQENRIEFFGENYAESLVATSREFITDRGATTIDVNAEAMLKAYGENGTGQSIVLADTAADQLRVGGDATLQSVADEMGAGGGADILVGIDPTTPDRMTDSGAAVNLGGTNFDSRSMGDTTRGDVSLLQENRIEFFGENYAESLVATSREFITDRGATTIDVNAEAMLKAYGENGTGQSIVLADTAADQLRVGGDATLQSVADEMGAGGGADIAVGVIPLSGAPDDTGRLTDSGATVTLGGTSFDTQNTDNTTRGDVTFFQENRVEFFGVSVAQTLVFTSGDFVSDRSDSAMSVYGDATFVGNGDNPEGRGIVLADDNVSPTTNSLLVGGTASFRVASGLGIDVGVVSANASPLNGTPALALANFGKLNFVAPQGAVRIAEDSGSLIAGLGFSGTRLEGESEAMDLRLEAEGDITDEIDAKIEASRSATLIAHAADVILGDGAAMLSMGAPALFDAAAFLSIQAINVSIQLDSAVNLRTAGEDANFDGTFFLSATGHVAQVGDGVADPLPLTADKIALASLGAVLMTGVALSSSVDDADAPNLAIRGGRAVPLSALPGGAFPLDIIPSDTTNVLSPVVDPATGEPDYFANPGSSGAAIGDNYSVVVVVQGDAKVGAVADVAASNPIDTLTSGDAPGPQGQLVGLSVVTHGFEAVLVEAEDQIPATDFGNAFLQTVALDDGQDEEGAPGEVGDLKFSARPANDTVSSSFEGVVVELSEDVTMTAVAAGELSIDTSAPDQPMGDRTTLLRSSTGAVTSVAEFAVLEFTGLFTEDTGEVIPGDALDTLVVGPLLLVDPPDDAADAATSDLVLAFNSALAGGLTTVPELTTADFVQLVTFVAGSRSESGVVLVVDWADIEAAALSFTDVPPGSYTFEVQARARDGVWSAPLQLFLERRPSWGELGIVRWGGPGLGVVLVVALLGAALARSRARNQQLREEVRQRESAERRLRVQQSENERVQRMLEASRRLEALGRLSGGIAHDFNNLLAAASGFAQPLTRHPEADVSESGDVIMEVIARGAKLTRQLLALGDRRGEPVRPTDVGQSLAALAPMLRRLIREDVGLEVEARSGLFARIEVGLLEQVIVNLVMNARDAIDGSGCIEVRLHRDLRGGTWWVVLDVVDDGRGLPTQVRERIFDPYFTTKELGRGTGLGLATVHRTIHEAGGLVEVRESREGWGTTMRVWLPEVRPDDDEELSEHDDPTPVAELRILVVDDEEAVMRATVRLLQMSGHEARGASSLREAVESVRAQPYDLLLTDVLLPYATGLDVREAVREVRPELPVVFMTGHAGDLVGSLSDEILVNKPFTVEQLLRAVGQAMRT